MELLRYSGILLIFTCQTTDYFFIKRFGIKMYAFKCIRMHFTYTDPIKYIHLQTSVISFAVIFRFLYVFCGVCIYMAVCWIVGTKVPTKYFRCLLRCKNTKRKRKGSSYPVVGCLCCDSETTTTTSTFIILYLYLHDYHRHYHHREMKYDALLWKGREKKDRKAVRKKGRKEGRWEDV